MIGRQILERCTAAALLMTFISCRERPRLETSRLVWTCVEHGDRCYCSQLDVKEGAHEVLCTPDYECCVYRMNLLTGPAATCECWNPSQGGPTCESQLPKDKPSWSVNRVKKCAG